MFARFLGAIRELERVPGQKLLRDWSDGEILATARDLHMAGGEQL
jgi:hypothetical protein